MGGFSALLKDFLDISRGKRGVLARVFSLAILRMIKDLQRRNVASLHTEAEAKADRSIDTAIVHGKGCDRLGLTVELPINQWRVVSAGQFRVRQWTKDLRLAT